MDKMKMQDMQLMQPSGYTASTIDDQSSVTGTTPATNSTSSQGTASQGARRPSWQRLEFDKSGTIHTHTYAQTNKHMYDWILLNTCSLIDLFCNRSFVCNVHQVNTTLSLATNAGTMTTNLQAELPGYGTVWFDPQAMTNVLSFGNITKQYPIQYLQESDTFQVQLHGHASIFSCEQGDNLYVLEGHQPQEDHQPTSSSQENLFPISATSHVQTIEENAKFLTPKEIAQANVAKQLLHTLGYPSVVILKTIIKMNMIQDNPVTKSDIKLMEHLYGPNIPTVEGKTTRQCQHKLASDVVSIPHELCDTQHDVCLYIVVMYINGMPFLTTISKNIKYRTAMWVADHMAPTIANLVESVLKLYSRASFQVKEVCLITNSSQFSTSSKTVDGPLQPILLILRNMFLKLSAIITSSRSIFMPLIMGFLTRCSQELSYATW